MRIRFRFASLASVSVGFGVGTPVALGAAVLAAGIVACTAGDDFLPKYGNPLGLPNAPEDAMVPELVTSSDGSTSVQTCVAGSTPSMYVDAGPCSVSWKNDIEALMTSPTAWDCVSGSCHGGPDSPHLTGDPDGDYSTLISYSSGFEHVYINPCSTDPDQSAMACNVTVGGVSSCDGMMAMPEVLATNAPATAAQVAKLTTWLQCGSPNN